VFRYKIHYADGSEASVAAYAGWVNVGETVMLGPGKTVRVLAVVPVEEDDRPYVGMLQVEST
jgi:hypothetical protein